MLWALGQPAAVAGLLAAFGLAVVLRSLSQWGAGRLLGLPDRPRPRRLDPVGLLAAALSGTGWGRPAAAHLPPGRRGFLVVLAGPVVVLLASQLAFVAYRLAAPGRWLPLRLNRPSDVLHGAIVPALSAQVLLSVAVGLLCFGLLALLPLPSFDGYRLLPAWAHRAGGPVERFTVIGVLLLLVVPVAGRPPLLVVLDLVAGPVVRAWA